LDSFNIRFVADVKEISLNKQLNFLYDDTACIKKYFPRTKTNPPIFIAVNNSTSVLRNSCPSSDIDLGK